MKNIIWAKRSLEWIKANPGKGTMYKTEYGDDIAPPDNAIPQVKRQYARKQQIEKEADVGVYVILCEASKSAYVGQSRSMGIRMRSHKMIIMNKNPATTIYSRMRSDYKKYGIGAFAFTRYKTLDKPYASDLLDLESRVMIEYINKGYALYNSYIPGTNMYCPPHLREKVQQYISELVNK